LARDHPDQFKIWYTVDRANPGAEVFHDLLIARLTSLDLTLFIVKKWVQGSLTEG
jgi:hypothetical protein